MKNKIITAVIVLIFAAGLLIFNYPVISTLYNQLHQGEVLTVYDDTLEKLEQEELQKLWKQAASYNRRISKEGPVLTDAFSEDGQDEDRDYLNILKLDDSGVMGSVEIPGIKVYLPIYHGTSTEVLKRGVGHLQGSSVPVGGKSTHSILTGHRGLPSAELFTNLDQVKKGDVFYIHMLKETLAYKVYKIEVIEPQDIDHLVIEKGRDLVTLITCTPYGINSHRLLLHAERTSYTEEERVDTRKARQDTLWEWLLKQKSFLISAGGAVLAIICTVIRLIWKAGQKRRRKKEEAER